MHRIATFVLLLFIMLICSRTELVYATKIGDLNIVSYSNINIDSFNNVEYDFYGEGGQYYDCGGPINESIFSRFNIIYNHYKYTETKTYLNNSYARYTQETIDNTVKQHNDNIFGGGCGSCNIVNQETRPINFNGNNQFDLSEICFGKGTKIYGPYDVDPDFIWAVNRCYTSPEKSISRITSDSTTEVGVQVTCQSGKTPRAMQVDGYITTAFSESPMDLNGLLLNGIKPSTEFWGQYI